MSSGVGEVRGGDGISVLKITRPLQHDEHSNADLLCEPGASCSAVLQAAIAHAHTHTQRCT